MIGRLIREPVWWNVGFHSPNLSDAAKAMINMMDVR
jgi:hypothetical protein